MKRTLRFTILLFALAIGFGPAAQAQLPTPDVSFGVRYGINMTRFKAVGFPDDLVKDNKVFGGDVNGLSDNASDHSKWNFRGQFGFYGRIMIGKFGIQPELGLNFQGAREIRTAVIDPGVYSNSFDYKPNYIKVDYRAGSQNDQSVVATDAVAGAKKDIRLRYEMASIQVPILFRYEFLKVVKPYVLAGPAFNYNFFGYHWFQQAHVNGDRNDVSTSDFQKVTMDEWGKGLGYSAKLTTLTADFILGGGVKFTDHFALEIRYDIGLGNPFKFNFQDASGHNYGSGYYRTRTLSFLLTHGF